MSVLAMRLIRAFSALPRCVLGVADQPQMLGVHAASGEAQVIYRQQGSNASHMERERYSMCAVRLPGEVKYPIPVLV